MGYEDIEIRIAKDGKVYIKLDGVTEERVRSVKAFLEEEIGPIQELIVETNPDWDNKASFQGVQSDNAITNTLD